jgi:hypothetical protein
MYDEDGTLMRIVPTLKSEAIYARDIVKAGLDAATSAGKVNAPGLARASQIALAPALLGAAVGVLGIYLGRKGRPGNAAVVGGLVGCALGFTGGVAWGTRVRTGAAARNALHNVQAVRDARWLEKNPVAYA